jgi:predicted Zn-dependent protease with MMP-like domain
MRRDFYERVVQETLDSLPDYLRSSIQNVAIVIEERPSRQQLHDAHIEPPMTLFGLYQGIALTQRGAWYGNVLPDKITIFRKPIEQYGRTSDDIAQIVYDTVLHEIGHHFGLNEAQLREIEQQRPAQQAGRPPLGERAVRPHRRRRTPPVPDSI